MHLVTCGQLSKSGAFEGKDLVSREFLFNSANRGLVVSGSEEICLMINEEDHLRIQAFSAGHNLGMAFEAANTLDNQLSSHLGFAYTDRLGYLTACPTNLGTGLRASLLMHGGSVAHVQLVRQVRPRSGLRCGNRTRAR